MTGLSDSTSTYCAMVRARSRLDGITAPICSGFSIHERRKRTSSSRRGGFFNARTDDCKGMSLPGGTARVRGCQKTVTKTYRAKPTRSSKTVLLTHYGLLRLPKKSLTLVKKLAASGWVAPDDSFSNSVSNSCCFLVRFCGVSTITWTYMSPVWRERSTGMPFDAMRNLRPDCVPEGTLTLVLALSMVGTSNSPPSEAVTIEIGTRQCRSAPSRWKNSWLASDRKM